MYSPSKTGQKILDAFQTLYESATGYGLRKALNTKKDELEGQKRERDLEERIEESHNEIEKLKGLKFKLWTINQDFDVYDVTF